MKKNKKNLLISGLIIIFALSGVGVGTYSFFTAQKTVTLSRFSAGTLDLSVDSGDSSLQPFIIDNVGASSDMTGNKTWKIKNTGTLPGRLVVSLQNVLNKENGCNDQERQAESNCDKDDNGELGKAINFNISLNGEKKISSDLSETGAAKLADDWTVLPQIILQPGEEVSLDADWSASENNYGNEVQSDSVSFDMDFRLVQQTTTQ
jgi:predicted ribosomally synthesized peptide with SipW-like signal peptide